MRIARFEYGGTDRWGFVDDGHALLPPQSAPSLLEEALGLGIDELAALRVSSLEGPALSELRLLAPVPSPPQFLGVGLNYKDHAEEAGLPRPANPQIFGLLPSAIIGPDEAIEMPASSRELDWEVELAIVIGKRGREISRECALDHVAGYTIINDLSVRDVQFADGQFTRGKSFDTLKPMGPWITTVDELGAAADLDLELSVNGVTKQSGNTAQLIFDVPHIVHFLSQEITLQPGAVISTGTPQGVGFSRKPPEFLGPGDVVRLEVSGIGTLTNTVAKPR